MESCTFTVPPVKGTVYECSVIFITPSTKFIERIIVRSSPSEIKIKTSLLTIFAGVVTSITPLALSVDLTTVRNPSCANAFTTVLSVAPVIVYRIGYV